MADDNTWAELENTLPRLWESNPTAAKAITAIKPMGWVEKYLLGGSRNVATTDMDGTIHYNKEAAMRDNTDPNVLLAHEMQHVKQNQGRSLLQNVYQRFKQASLPWESRPDEIDAMAKEYPVRGFARTTDVNLPASVRAIK